MGEIGKYWRDVKAHKRQRESSSARRMRRNRARARKEQQELATLEKKQNALSFTKRKRQARATAQKRQQEDSRAVVVQRRRCWDWMIVTGDRHYARNRSSFKTYQRIPPSPGGLVIVGIGTVELEVVRSPTDSRTHTIILENVLHMPDAVCNGFCAPMLGGIQMWCSGNIHGFSGSGWEALYHGVQYCGGVNRLVLAGDPQGESPLQESMERGGMEFMLSLRLSEEELSYLRVEQRRMELEM